ncbi:MAG: MIP/aquaporin family protein [Candidatus Brocadiales bacterium]
MDDYKPYVAEAVGTFMLVFIGAGSICTDYYLKQAGEPGIGLLGIAIAFGFVVVTVVYSIGYISGGHINPAATVAFWATKRMEANTAIFYISSQIIGAALGGFLLKVLFPDALASVNLGVTKLGTGVNIYQALTMEIILTFFLVFTLFATLVDPRAPKGLGGLAIGLVFLIGVLVGGPITGGSMNPARTFGPALASGFFENHIIYWIGPMLGGMAAGLLYDRTFAEGGRRR